MRQALRQLVIHILTLEARLMFITRRPKVVAITGSLGKTGAKDAIAAGLAVKYRVHKSPKSFNSEFGVPLTILDLPNGWNNPLVWLFDILMGVVRLCTWWPYPEILVLEVGADKPGDIAQVARWLALDIAVVTAVPEVPVHVAYYPTAADVLREKGSLIDGLMSGGTLITGDDPQVRTLTNTHGPTVRVGFAPDTQIHITDASVTYSKEGRVAGMHFGVNDYSLYRTGVLGEHQAYALAFAIAVAEQYDVPHDMLASALESMPHTPGRMRIVPGKHDTTLIDDSYNSSPTALAAALDALGKLEVSGRKVAILGDMRELGEHTEREHRRAGMRAAQVVDVLYTVGEDARLMAQAAQDEGLPAEHIYSYSTDGAQQAGRDAYAASRPGDTILVKSSQGTLRLERAVKELMTEPERAGELLVRQESEWLRR